MDFEPIDDESVDKLESFSELHNYRKALEEELLKTNISSSDSPDEIRVKARKFAIQYLPMALQRIATLAETADKDSVQLAACKTIVAIAQSTSLKDDGNPIEDLFNQLTKTKDATAKG